MNLKIEGIIFSNIYKENNITDWLEYKINIIDNLNNINFMNYIENYVKCNKKLYVTRPRLRTELYKYITCNNKIFKEVGYNTYESHEGYNINRYDIYNFIEICVNIIVTKQQVK